MPTALPPIPQADFDEHQESQFVESTRRLEEEAERARAAQAAADQAAEAEFVQRGQAQVAGLQQQQADIDQGRTFLEETDRRIAALGQVAQPPPQPLFPQGAGPPRGAPGPTDEASALQRVYRDARAAGLDEEGARVAAAVARTEHGYAGALGDADVGGSAGTFQLFHGGGMGDEYARQQGLTREQSIARLRADPHAANQWALSGYLGQAIREGQRQGLHGADLATYAQRVGQRSVSPERTGANYAAILGQPFDQAPPSTPAGPYAPSAPATAEFGGQNRRQRAEAVGQFEQGLPYEVAAAICGPVAALAFAQANGRNPDLGEARRLAQARGWTAAGGMNGVANEQALLTDLGVKSRLDTNPDFGEIAHDAASGNPVIVSTPKHYYYVNGYDESTGRLRVGKTGEARRGGSAWMSAQQIAELDGGINGVLYVDYPQSPTPSVAAADTSGERPPSEFEQPSAFAPRAEDVAGGLEKGYTGQPEAVVEESSDDEPLTPNRPPFGMEGLLAAGPVGVRVPTLPPAISPNVAPPGRREQERVERGEAPIAGVEDITGHGAGTLARLTSGEESLDFSNPRSAIQSIVKVVSAAADAGMLGRFFTRQGQSEPGVLAEMMRPGAAREAEETIAQQEARGGRGGAPLGSPSLAGLGEDVPGPGDFASYMQRKKDEAAGKPTKPIQRSPMGMRAYEEAARAGAEVEGLPTTATPRPLPPLTDNYRKSLGAYADRLYHETGAGFADEFLPLPGKFQRGETQTFLANTPEMALGQGNNRGVLLEFDAGAIQGQVNTRKPMWEPAWEQGQAEFVARGNAGRTYEEALRSVTVKPDVAGTPGERMRLKNNLARLERAGWERTANPDGSVTYRRPAGAGGGAAPLWASDEEAARARAVEPGLFSEETPATAADIAALRERLPVWAKDSGLVPEPLEPVAGTRPGAGLAASTETAGRATPPRTVTEVGQQRAPIEVTVPGTGTERALARPEARSIGEVWRDAKAQLYREAYDRNHNLRQIDAVAGLDPLTGAHAAMQIVPGAVAAGEDLVRRRVMPILTGLGRDVNVLERYWFLKSAEDVARRAPGVLLPGGINGQAGVQAELAALARRYGPERIARADAAMQELNALNDELRLRPLRDEGLISPEQYQDYRVNNPHYLPFHRYDYSGEGVGHLLPPRPEASASAVDLGKRSLVGSSKALDQPIARWMADLIDTQKRLFQNRAATELVEALGIADRKGGGHDVLVGTREALERAGRGRETRTRGVVRFYDPATPGVEQYADVPKVFADIAKNAEREPTNSFLKIASALAAPLRVGATSLSLAFLPRNVLRDLQSAWTKEGIAPWSPEMIAGWRAALAKNTDFSRAAAAGALQSGLLESRRTTDALARARGLRGGIQVSTPQDALLLLPRLLGKAASPIMRANEIAEQAPRLATFLKAERGGAGAREAAVRARDVTVDFSKSGNFVRMLNQMVPFLNARVQGEANMLRMLREDKRGALTRVLAPATFLSTAAMVWNQQWESSQKIPDSEWERNWVFQFGEGHEAPDPRRPNAQPETFPLYVKIPKGDAMAIGSAVPEAMLRVALGQGDRTPMELLGRAASAATRGLSPVEPTAGGALGVLMPPAAAVGSAIQSNYDPFRQRPIVPPGEVERPPREQFGPETSESAAIAGRALGVSPRNVEYAVRGFTGGAGQQALWLGDILANLTGTAPEVPGAARRQARTTLEEAARAPGVSGLVGALNVGEAALGRERLASAARATQERVYDFPDARRLGVNVAPVEDAIGSLVLTPTERVRYQERTGELVPEMLAQFAASPEYARAPDAVKRTLLVNAIGVARRRAAAEILSAMDRARAPERVRLP